MKKENITTLTEMPTLPSNLSNLSDLSNSSTLPTYHCSLSNPFNLCRLTVLNEESFHQLHLVASESYPLVSLQYFISLFFV